ncbi:translation initiation factor 2 [Pseudomonas zhanjiangensis]|uniref:Translation initiation factor 2 n=1 Tax=Pseudomonas zhanjiangensis TaxID=3239015 RepID=A0ABV3YS32_9PSED
MRPVLLPWLLAATLLPLHLHAEQTPDPGDAALLSAHARIDELEQRLATSEQQREELGAELQANAAMLANNGERDSAQLQRLRQENRRLKLQLQKTQAAVPARLISEQQLWFVIGVAATLLGTLLGALLRGNRRTRREWIN